MADVINERPYKGIYWVIRGFDGEKRGLGFRGFWEIKGIHDDLRGYQVIKEDLRKFKGI